MMLYKYRADSEYTEAIFIKGKVWLSTASQLNDPFECSIQEIASEWIEDRVREGKQAQLMGFILSARDSINSRKPFYGLPHKKTKKLLDKMQRYNNLDLAYGEMKKFIKSKTGVFPQDLAATFKEFDKQLNNVGIFSLSSNPAQQLMWAHYGDEFRGLAIGFEKLSGSKLSDPSHCVQVMYSNDVPAFVGGELMVESSYKVGSNVITHNRKISFNDPTFKAAISTKSESWSYEDEWRYVEEAPGEYDHPGPLKEVIFGLNCKKEVIGKYIHLANTHIAHKVSFRKILRVKNTNQIELVSLSNDEISSYLEDA
jgi:hypothetical protein